jgi:hypothetical protein
MGEELGLVIGLVNRRTDLALVMGERVSTEGENRGEVACEVR